MLTSLLLAAAAGAAPCPAFDQTLPLELKPWASPTQATMLNPGRAIMLTLRPSSVLEGTTRAETSFGGAIPLRITKPGRYGIAASHGAWIDLTLGKGPALKSANHRHGPECSTIRKIVEFELAPGTYSLQISKSPVASIKLLVVRN